MSARSAMRASLAAVLPSLVSVGCLLGPNYARPPIEPPEAFRGAMAAPDSAIAQTFGDQSWWEVFQDDELRGLIRTALERNYDARIAAIRVVEAQAQLGIIRADQFPAVSAGGALFGERVSTARGASANASGPLLQLQGTASWELDFWGRFRRATEAGRAQLLGTEWGRRAVLTTLVSQVADAYFALRALDLKLDVSVRTLASRQESLRLTQVREQGGATSLVDVRQAEQLVYSASSEIVDLQRLIEQQENFISLLLGMNPGGVPRGRLLTEQPQPPEVPAGLPSSLLERRPDIQLAEQQVVAANAQIGVAKTAFFPDITLTGTGGVQSAGLTSLFSSPAPILSAAATAIAPIFTAGRTRAQVALAEARQQEAVLAYQQTVQQAFHDVSDSLVGYRKMREFRSQQALLRDSAEDARRLAQIRYEGGATGYLEVLDADTRLFAAELGLAQAQLNELESLVSIYRALGGGWRP